MGSRGPGLFQSLLPRILELPKVESSSEEQNPSGGDAMRSQAATSASEKLAASDGDGKGGSLQQQAEVQEIATSISPTAVPATKSAARPVPPRTNGICTVPNARSLAPKKSSSVPAGLGGMGARAAAGAKLAVAPAYKPAGHRCVEGVLRNL